MHHLLNASGQHWVAELADFNFTIKYRPGKTNADTDGLSRMPIGFKGYMSRCTQTVSQDAVAASQQCILVQQTEQAPMFSAVSFDALQQQALAEGLLDTIQPLPREEIHAA